MLGFFRLRYACICSLSYTIQCFPVTVGEVKEASSRSLLLASYRQLMPVVIHQLTCSVIRQCLCKVQALFIPGLFC